MATEALKHRRFFSSPVHARVALVNAAAGIIGLGASVMAGPGVAKGFAAGYAIGLVNLLWLLRIATRGLTMTPERAGRYVAVRYYIRFILTAGIFIILIKNGILSPWPPVAGLSASIFATIGALVISAREESS
jgi:hypothetical protein